MGLLLDIGEVLDAVSNLPAEEALAKDLAGCHPGEVNRACALLSYVEGFMRIKRDYIDPHPVGVKLPRPGVVADLEGNLGSVFEEGVLRGRPFRQQMGLRSNVSADFCEADAAVFHGLVDPVTKDVALQNCAFNRREHLQEYVTIPPVAAGSYLHRLGAGLTMSVDGMTDFLRQWPAVMPLPGNSHWSSITQCPLDMHMIVWGAEKSVNLRLFLKAVSAKLSPSLGNRPNVYPHHIDYGDLSDRSESTLPKFSEATLEEKQYIFIPNTYLAQFASQNKDDHESTLLKFCLVDASNYQVFKRALKMESKLSGKAVKMLKTMYSPSFRTSMMRDAKELPWRDAFDDEKHKYEGKSDGGGDTTEVDGKSRRRRRNKGGGGGGSQFKDWQGLAKWNTLVSSLTLPEPPEIKVSPGRRNMTVGWLCNFNPSTTDTTTYGYNLTVCPQLGDGKFDEEDGCFTTFLGRGMGLLESIDMKASIEEGSEVYSVSGTVPGLEPDVTYRMRAVLIYGLSASNPSHWSIPFRTFPLTVPSQVPGKVVLSPAVLPMTMSISIPKPLDDGGSEILGYHVLRRYHHRTGDTSTHDFIWVGDFKSISSDDDPTSVVVVGGFRPNSLVEVRVAAYNAQGNGTHSASNTVSTGPLTEANKDRDNRKLDKTIYGRGTETHRPIPLDKGEDRRAYYEAHPHARESFLDSTSCLVTLDEKAQTVDYTERTIKDANSQRASSTAMSVWSSHWSPKIFDVVSEVAWMDETASPDDLHDLLHDRIAVVLRGGTTLVSKVRKAQIAGATAVYIVDDGSCAKFDQLCIPGADKGRGEFFAARDAPKLWMQTRIPVVLGLHKQSLDFFHGCNLTTPAFVEAYRDVAWTVLEQRLGRKLTAEDMHNFGLDATPVAAPAPSQADEL